MNEPFSPQDVAFMQLALDLAKQGEFTTTPNPSVGCVLVKDGEVVGKGFHAKAGEPHAEVMAIEKANQHEHSWRLLDTTLFVTIEPCVMCSGAIGLARIPQVIYGAKNPKFGAAGSLYDILTDERLNHRVELETGILEVECAQMMQDFFRKRRQR